jgi:hypothetical protein
MARLLAGKSISAVARDNGIHRSTIYHWRNEHPYFNIVFDQALAFLISGINLIDGSTAGEIDP